MIVSQNNYIADASRVKPSLLIEKMGRENQDFASLLVETNGNTIFQPKTAKEHIITTASQERVENPDMSLVSSAPFDEKAQRLLDSLIDSLRDIYPDLQTIAPDESQAMALQIAQPSPDLMATQEDEDLKAMVGVAQEISTEQTDFDDVAYDNVYPDREPADRNDLVHPVRVAYEKLEHGRIPEVSLTLSHNHSNEDQAGPIGITHVNSSKHTSHVSNHDSLTDVLDNGSWPDAPDRDPSTVLSPGPRYTTDQIHVRHDTVQKGNDNLARGDRPAFGRASHSTHDDLGAEVRGDRPGRSDVMSESKIVTEHQPQDDVTPENKEFRAQDFALKREMPRAENQHRQEPESRYPELEKSQPKDTSRDSLHQHYIKNNPSSTISSQALSANKLSLNTESGQEKSGNELLENEVISPHNFNISDENQPNFLSKSEEVLANRLREDVKINVNPKTVSLQDSGLDSDTHKASKTILLRLEPPGLDTILVRVRQINDDIVASFVTRSHQTRDLLQSHFPILREALSEMGLPNQQISFHVTPQHGWSEQSGQFASQGNPHAWDGHENSYRVYENQGENDEEITLAKTYRDNLIDITI